MRRIVIVVALLIIGGLTLASVTQPEPTPTALFAQAVEGLTSNSPYQGALEIHLAVEPREESLDLSERLVLESLREITLRLNVHKSAGEPETASLTWQGQTNSVEAGEIATLWWEQFAPHELVTKNRDQCQIAGMLSVMPLLPNTSSPSDPVSLLMQDLTAGVEQIPATLILKPQRWWLWMRYQVEALEFSWSQTLAGDQLSSFPLGSLTKNATLSLSGRLELTPQVVAE